MTGADKGACEPLTGTPYVGSDQISASCASSSPVDLGQNGNSPFGAGFTVQSPAKAVQAERSRNSSVTGTSYENSSNITGPFDMAPNKVTGTEQFRFDAPARRPQSVPSPNEVQNVDEATRVQSRITGEGQSAGLNITGDDWARGESMTGTEGTSATRRNPSRTGGMSAMPAFEPKRNEELAKPTLLITGSSGNTGQGQLVTFSGGARG
jgi:hypothetical protein